MTIVVMFDLIHSLLADIVRYMLLCVGITKRLPYVNCNQNPKQAVQFMKFIFRFHRNNRPSKQADSMNYFLVTAVQLEWLVVKLSLIIIWDSDERERFNLICVKDRPPHAATDWLPLDKLSFAGFLQQLKTLLILVFVHQLRDVFLLSCLTCIPLVHISG